MSDEVKLMRATQRSILLVMSMLGVLWAASGFTECMAHGQSRTVTKSSHPRVKAAAAAKKPVAKKAVAKKAVARKPRMTVEQWFARYDQLRTDAEMTMADKWQSLLLQADKPNKENADLAIRMTKKYTIALSEMKKLGYTAETKPLQEGYIQYFGNARKLFADYLAAQKAVPFTNRALVPTKKKLELLDKKNKQVDDALRKRYAIKKH